MDPIRKIAILIHENERTPLEPRYIAAALGEAWRSMGLEVEVVRGIGGSVEADLWLPNVDLTVTPPAYQRFLEACPRVVNRRVVDISKRSFSELQVNRGDGYRGPVIVKSNRNYGGRPERRLLEGEAAGRASSWRESMGRLVRQRLGLQEPIDPSVPLHPRYYPIFETPEQVPESAFTSEELVVERFVPERQGRLYVLRSCGVAGEESFHVRTTSKRPVVKADAIVDREVLPAPRSILDHAARLGLDFGKLDYVMQAGEVRLLDVNRTPMFRRYRGGYDPEQWEVALRFARGLLERFEKAAGDVRAPHG